MVKKTKRDYVLTNGKYYYLGVRYGFMVDVEHAEGYTKKQAVKVQGREQAHENAHASKRRLIRVQERIITFTVKDVKCTSKKNTM